MDLFCDMWNIHKIYIMQIKLMRNDEYFFKRIKVCNPSIYFLVEATSDSRIIHNLDLPFYGLVFLT